MKALRTAPIGCDDEKTLEEFKEEIACLRVEKTVLKLDELKQTYRGDPEKVSSSCLELNFTACRGYGKS